MRPRQNCWYFAGDIFKHIFLNENCLILIQISLRFVPKRRIHNNTALVLIMAWRREGDKPLSYKIVYWRIYASLGLKELEFNNISSTIFNHADWSPKFNPKSPKATGTLKKTWLFCNQCCGGWPSDVKYQWPILLTWIDLSPGMDK